MMKPLFPTLFLIVCASLYWQCGQNSSTPNSANSASATTPPAATPVNNVQLITHQEAADTLRTDTTQALKPLIYKTLSPAAAKAVLTQHNIGSLVVSDAPDNGFYGDNYYRIEFILTEMVPVPDNPLLYKVKGKNRYKKTISSFAGVLEIKTIAEFVDPNLDPAYLTGGDINVEKSYALQGKFNFKEDSTLSSSGQFSGDFSMEFYTPNVAAAEKAQSDTDPQLWFFSDASPSQGSGYRFVGNWTGFKNSSVKKPVIWSRDLFRFANNILENFSYGERDVTINPKYRALGWDNFWEGEEWWNDAPKDGENQAK